MVLVNYSTKEIVAKIVYYGPGLCGKTTNLQHVYQKLNPKKRGKIISLATEADRTLFFDFLPVELGIVQGFKVRFQLYTVPGQVFYSATRKLVLKGTDAVVFVADSQADVLSKNLESVEDMKQNLMENSLDPFTIPIAFQYNKRDLDNVLDVGLLDEKLNYRKAPWFEAAAVNGDGVMETFKEVTRLLIKDLKKKHSMMDSDVIQELPPEVFEQKAEPKEPDEAEEAEEALEIEMGSAIREEGADADVEAGSLLGEIETIALTDRAQAEVFLDNVRKGEPAEEARQKALNAQESEGAGEAEHDRYSLAEERELTPEEIEYAETLPELDDIVKPGAPAGSLDEFLGLDLAGPDMMEKSGPGSAKAPPETLAREAPAESEPGRGDAPKSQPELAAVLLAIDRLENEVRSLSREIKQIGARGGGDIEGGLAGITARLEELEESYKNALEGQDRLMLSILESVRDLKNIGFAAQERLDDGLRHLVERLKEEQKGRRKWF